MEAHVCILITEYFNDIVSQQKIMAAKTPGLQKKLGRAVKLYNDDQWAQVRYGVMLKASIAKVHHMTTTTS